jgi:hypothetical protein
MIKVNGIEVTKGCTVKFRCGGEAVVDDWADNVRGITSKLFLEGYNEDEHLIYYNTGKFFDDEKYPLDIIEVIPPAFDWKDVKAGMAFFINKGESPWIYVGKDITHENDVRVFLRDEDYNGWGVDCGHTITRAPEHDLEDIK